MEQQATANHRTMETKGNIALLRIKDLLPLYVPSSLFIKFAIVPIINNKIAEQLQQPPQPYTKTDKQQ